MDGPLEFAAMAGDAAAMRSLPSLAILAGFVLAAAPALSTAASGDFRSSRAKPAADRYDACLARAAKQPEPAYEDAMSWRAEGGGPPSEHCAAVALTGMKKYADAGERLDKLGENPGLGDAAMRAEVLAQAGNAWLLAGRPAQAVQSFNASLSFMPDDADTLVDRARASALLGKWPAAEQDLSTALIKDSSMVEALVLRASARRAQGNWPGAEGDATKAILLDANSLEALVELGLIRAGKGDRAGAREAFLAVLAKDAKSPAADSAREAIAKLDVPPPRTPRILPNKPGQAAAPAPSGLRPATRP
jgi:tetratricopeptide (TPR) repeat protein